MRESFVILTGASGSGKTAIADHIALHHPSAQVFRFDSIGVPDAATMKSYGDGHQPGGAWQRAMTLEWLGRIAALREQESPILFEGQMRISFLQEGLRLYGLAAARVVLVDCDDATRSLRLLQRGQPELAGEATARWAGYLREEAMREGVPVLDTTSRPLAHSVEYVITLLGLKSITP